MEMSAIANLYRANGGPDDPAHCTFCPNPIRPGDIIDDIGQVGGRRAFSHRSCTLSALRQVVEARDRRGVSCDVTETKSGPVATPAL